MDRITPEQRKDIERTLADYVPGYKQVTPEQLRENLEKHAAFVNSPKYDRVMQKLANIEACAFGSDVGEYADWNTGTVDPYSEER